MLNWLRSPRFWAVAALIMLLAAITNVISAIVAVATDQAGIGLLCALLAGGNGFLAWLFRHAGRKLREADHA